MPSSNWNEGYYNPTTMIDPSKNKQLFLDDYAIESMFGVQRKLHQPDRLGPVLRPDTGIGQTHVQSSTAPQWNSETERWEMVVSAAYDLNGGEVFYKEFVTSANGVEWQTESDGRYAGAAPYSDRAFYMSDDRHLDHFLREEADPDPARRYKALFSNRRHCDRHPGFSPDGREWTMPDVSPIPSNDTSEVFIDDISGRYVATVKHRTEWGRSAWLSTSDDFVDWTLPRLIMHTDEIDRENRAKRIQKVVDDPDYLTPGSVDDTPYNAEVYVLPIMPYEGIYVGFPLIFNPSGLDSLQMNNTGINQNELAVSRDLMSWERVANREVWLGVEPWDGVNYGTAQVSVNGQPIVRDGEIWVYYHAYRFRGHRSLFAHVDEKYHKDWGAICLAKLRLDGFVSLEALEEGTLVTKPFETNGGRLMVNVDAQGGDMKAEVLDAKSMAPLDGYSLAESVPQTGDHVAGQVAWKHADLPRSTIRIRFRLRKADLYAFWVE